LLARVDFPDGYTDKSNRSVDLGYIKKPKVLGRITGNILKNIDLSSNMLRIGGYAVSMLHVTRCLVRDWSACSS
jgi:hypothetical protein